MFETFLIPEALGKKQTIVYQLSHENEFWEALHSVIFKLILNLGNSREVIRCTNFGTMRYMTYDEGLKKEKSFCP